MNISNIVAKLSKEDIISIIDDFVEVEGLKIDEIDINDIIIVKGSYKKGLTIPFVANLSFGSVENNVIKIMVLKTKVAHIGILNSVKKFGLKTALKSFSSKGITTEKDTIYIDMNILSKYIPYVNFKIEAISCEDNLVKVELNSLNYSDKKKTDNTEEIIEEKKYLKKNDDKYSNIRKDLDNKTPDKYKKFVEYMLMIPDIITLLYRLFKDKRIKVGTKALIGAIMGYLVCPIDILPDFIPFIGSIDDLAIAFFGLNKLINEIPEEIILENWPGEDNIILIIKSGVKAISDFVGAGNVAKVVNKIKESVNAGKKDEESTNIH